MEKKRVQDVRKKTLEASAQEKARLRDRDAVHDKRLDALRAQMESAPPPTVKKSPAKSLDTSLPASVARAVEGKEWDAAARQKVETRAAELLPLVDGDQKTAITIAVTDIEKEVEEEWNLVGRSNRKSHRSPPKTPVNDKDPLPTSPAAASTASRNSPIITHVIAAEKANRETLARSRMADWRPKLADRFKDGSHSAYVAQKRAFQSVTGAQGIAPVDRLGELRFWSDGLPLNLIGRTPAGIRVGTTRF